MKKLKRNDRHEYWENHIKNWKESGLRQVEFCRKNKLDQSLFSCWKKRLNVDTSAPKQKLIDITGLLKQEDPYHFQIVFPGNIKLQINNGADLHSIEALIQKLK